MTWTTNTALWRDPTRTTTLRTAYAQELGKRFRLLKTQISQKVVTEDYFRLTDKRPAFSLLDDRPVQLYDSVLSFGVIHHVTAYLVVLVAEAGVAGVCGIQQDAGVFDAARSQHEDFCTDFERVALAGHDDTMSDPSVPHPVFEPYQGSVQIQVGILSVEDMPKLPPEILGGAGRHEDLFVESFP